MSSTTSFVQPDHRLTLIPGPIEFSNPVLAAMSTPSQAHTSPEFVATFQGVLKNLRKLFKSTNPKTQPYVLSGSGTLGWDVAATNLINPGDDVLVLSTGYFSDSFADCLGIYGAKVDVLTAKVGDVVPLVQIKSKLLEKKSYKAITITHVDTSTSVVSDVKAVSELVKQISPETLIIVDGVCSVGVEDLEFDQWGLDFVLTASQKAIGVPAGLSILYASERALEIALTKKETTYFASLKRWTPIMQSYESGKGAYFATPAVQTITALRASLEEILSESLETRFSKHEQVSTEFKNAVTKMGLKILPVSRDVAANGLSAVYFPEGIDGNELLKKLAQRGFTIAGGIHKQLVGKYFRVGHMGYSVYAGHIPTFTKALEESLNELK